MAALANEIVVLHANAGGRIDRLSRAAMANGNTVWTLDLPDNADLIGPLAGHRRLNRSHRPGGAEQLATPVKEDWPEYAPIPSTGQ